MLLATQGAASGSEAKQILVSDPYVRDTPAKYGRLTTLPRRDAIDHARSLATPIVSHKTSNAPHPISDRESAVLEVLQQSP